MSAERDRLPVMVLRVVDNADALHGAVASGMMTASPRSLARRAEPHHRMTSDECDDRLVKLDADIATQAVGLPSPLWGGESTELAAPVFFQLRDRDYQASSALCRPVPIPRMKRWRMRTGSRGVCAVPDVSSIFAASSTGPPSSKRRDINVPKCAASRTHRTSCVE